MLDILSLSSFKSYSDSEDELFKVSLINKNFKMLLEDTTLNSVTPLTVVVETILLSSRTSWVMLKWLWTLHIGLALDGAEYLVNRML